MLGLAGLSGRAYASLSGGEQRKTLIATAMVQQPEILLLDNRPQTSTSSRASTSLKRSGGCMRRNGPDDPHGLPRVGSHSTVLPAPTSAPQRPSFRRRSAGRSDDLPHDRNLYGTRLKLLLTGSRYATVPAGEGRI